MYFVLKERLYFLLENVRGVRIRILLEWVSGKLCRGCSLVSRLSYVHQYFPTRYTISVHRESRHISTKVLHLLLRTFWDQNMCKSVLCHYHVVSEPSWVYDRNRNRTPQQLFVFVLIKNCSACGSSHLSCHDNWLFCWKLIIWDCNSFGLGRGTEHFPSW